MRNQRALVLVSLTALTIAVVVGFMWPVSEDACTARGGWIDYLRRVCFTPDSSEPTRLLRHVYFAWLGLFVTLLLVLAAPGPLARAVLRAWQRAA